MQRSRSPITETDVSITVGPVTLQGMLALTPEARGVVVFAHGSGSGRLSPRNTFVARVLQTGGLATLLIDLLEPQEAEDRRKVFDIDLLADRLLAAHAWIARQAATHNFAVGYFGASTGAGAALQAAARSPSPCLPATARLCTKASKARRLSSQSSCRQDAMARAARAWRADRAK